MPCCWRCRATILQLQGGDYQGKLVWDARQLQAVCGGAVDDWLNRHSLCLLLTHQGPDWLTPEAQQHGASEIAPAGRFAVHLFGHMHEARLEYIRKGGNPDAVRLCQGGSVFGMELFGEPPTLRRSHGYAAGRIDFNKKAASLRIWPRIATNKTGPWRFIPDHENAHLQADQATAPETLKLRLAAKPGARGLPCAKRQAAQGKPCTPAPSTLPPRQPFFGRAAELAAVAKYLQPGHVGWGVVLDGPGGIGKTALALEAAYRAPAEHYPLKVFVTAKGRRLAPDGPHRLHDNRVKDYHALLTGIGMALGQTDIQKIPQAKQAEFVRLALASQRALLVLDNLESLSKEERRRVYDWLDFLPAPCKAIVTSRRRDQTSAHVLRLDKLDFEASQHLLAALAERWPPIAKLTEDEQQRLYAETGGNPLLLTWTAGQLGRSESRCRTVEQALERLRVAHARQARDDTNDPLEFIFGDLLDTFTVHETAVLAALAHFSEPARLDWLLPLAELSQTAALTALDDLHNRALLLEDEANETWLLPPSAAHFLRLRRPEAVGAAGQRLEERAYALAVQYGGNSDKAQLTELEKAWPTVQAALPLLLAGDNTRLQTVCDALGDFLEFTGRWEILLNLSLDAEARALTMGDYDKAGRRVYDAGWVYSLLCDAKAVLVCAERCAQQWQQAGAGFRERAITIRLLGLGYGLQKDFPAAISTFEMLLAIYRSLNPESMDAAIGLNDLAGVKRASGDLCGAEADSREALRLARKLGYGESIATYTGNLAELALNRTDWLAAEHLAIEALVLSKDAGRLLLIAANHHTLAEALRQQQRAAEALPHAQEAVAIYTRLRHPNLAEAEATLAACEAALAVG